MLKEKNIIALLDTFYSPSYAGQRAPLWWPPIDSTISTQRLLRIVGHNNFLCINSCPIIVSKATEHGVPNPQYVAAILRRLEPISVLIVCGTVAKATLKLSPYKTYARLVFMPHPAWRAWTKQLEKEYAAHLPSGSRQT